jgi:hypothetical protein
MTDKTPCPYCGAEQLPTTTTITKSTVPAEIISFCCVGAQAKWLEHYEGEILRMPNIELPPK